MTKTASRHRTGIVEKRGEVEGVEVELVRMRMWVLVGVGKGVLGGPRARSWENSVATGSAPSHIADN